VLPYENRLRRPAEFRSVIATGRRARRGCVVVHFQPGFGGTDGIGPPAPIVGFVVGRSVGGSVVRHQVSRRLRAQMQLRLTELPDGSAVVVRALPDSGTATSAMLGQDLDAALRRVR
jgi:ribonuclease P protein component